MFNSNYTNQTNKKKLDQSEELESRIRILQKMCKQKSIFLCIPIEFTYRLGLSKGDYVKCSINNSDNNNNKKQLIVEKLLDQ